MTKDQAIQILDDGESVWIYYSHKHVKCSPNYIRDYHVDTGTEDFMNLTFNWDAAASQPYPVTMNVVLSKVFATKEESIAGYDATQDVSTSYAYIYPRESQGV